MTFEIKNNINNLVKVPFRELHIGDVFILEGDLTKNGDILDVNIKISPEYLQSEIEINTISTSNWITFEADHEDMCYIVDMKNPIISYNDIRRLN